MTIAYRRRSIPGPLLSAATPYAEKSDRRQSRLDRALLKAWGCASSYLLSRAGHRQRERLVEHAENQEKQLTSLSDQQLRQAADELRCRLVSAGSNLDGIPSAFALAREAARRHTGMRHFGVQLLGGVAM